MISHLAASTATAIVAILTAFVFARRSARWRHAILLAAVLRFAVPTGWLIEAGAALVRFAPPATIPSQAADELGDMLLAKRGALIVSRAVTPWRPNLPWVWAGGFLVCAALWTRRWSRRPATVRPPNPAEFDAFHRAVQQLPGRSIVSLAVVDSDFTPGVRGIWRPCILLPEGLSTELSGDELGTVMAHELAHVRRHDNLVALITHVIVAAFWFHPLVWWIERRMLLERENACDEMVLAGGVAADVYAAGILRVCRRSLNLSGAYAAFTGPNLVHRIKHIMSADSRSSRSFLSRAALCTLVAFALLTPVGSGFLAAHPGPAPQPAPQATPQTAPQPHSAPQPNPAPPAIMFRVEDLLRQEKAEEALALLENEIERNPSRVDLQVALGNAATRTKHYDLAISIFQKVLESRDQDSKAAADLYLRIGETHRRKGELKLAVESLLRAKALAPDNTTIVSTLALTLDGVGEVEAARHEYEAVLVLDPANWVAMNNLAFLLAQHGGSLDRALELALQARDINPDHANISDTVGWIQLKRNDPDKAMSAFREAIQADPSSAEIHYHLAMAFTAKGNSGDAIRELQTALTLNPSTSDRDKIRELMDRLRH